MSSIIQHGYSKWFHPKFLFNASLIFINISVLGLDSEHCTIYCTENV